MPRHDIIAIGASSGGVEALQRLVRQLQPGFPAALFVVLHTYPRTKSFLPEILNRAGGLPAAHAIDGSPIEPGRIYVAPPDHHLVIEQDHIHLSTGPKEYHQRPCINVTFRSAAQACGDRVVGVVLTGQMDDGTAGLREIKRHRGVAVVQNPEEALFPSMPLNALREIETDHTVRLAEIGPLLYRLAAGEAARTVETERTDLEPQLTDLTCPDCRGTIREAPRGNSSETQLAARFGPDIGERPPRGGARAPHTGADRPRCAASETVVQPGVDRTVPIGTIRPRTYEDHSRLFPKSS